MLGGNKIRDLRLDAKLTQAELGNMIGRHRNTIAKLEREGTGDVGDVLLIARALRVDPGELDPDLAIEEGPPVEATARSPELITKDYYVEKPVSEEAMKNRIVGIAVKLSGEHLKHLYDSAVMCEKCHEAEAGQKNIKSVS